MMLDAYDVTLKPVARVSLEFELQHAVENIERAALLTRGSELEADLARLLEAARATLDLIKETAL